jgi:hypothetical protein
MGHATIQGVLSVQKWVGWVMVHKAAVAGDWPGFPLSSPRSWPTLLARCLADVSHPVGGGSTTQQGDDGVQVCALLFNSSI